jgi:hypothetical protein
MEMKTEMELMDVGFIHLYVVSGSISVWGRGTERYYCENGKAIYHYDASNDAKERAKIKIL